MALFHQDRSIERVLHLGPGRDVMPFVLPSHVAVRPSNGTFHNYNSDICNIVCVPSARPFHHDYGNGHNLAVYVTTSPMPNVICRFSNPFARNPTIRRHSNYPQNPFETDILDLNTRQINKKSCSCLLLFAADGLNRVLSLLKRQNVLCYLFS